MNMRRPMPGAPGEASRPVAAPRASVDVNVVVKREGDDEMQAKLDALTVAVASVLAVGNQIAAAQEVQAVKIKALSDDLALQAKVPPTVEAMMPSDEARAAGSGGRA